MKKLLITGFDAFGGEQINPSWEAVLRLPDEIKEYKLTKICIPVVFGKAADVAIRAAEKLSADVVLCIGQAGGRDAITPELVGINLRYANAPDNSGRAPKDEPVIAGGENALFSALPVRRMAEKIKEADIPARVSYSAGAYVCNDLLYRLLSRFEGSKTRVGFIHVPYMKEQNKEPSMEIEDIIKGLTLAIEAIDE